MSVSPDSRVLVETPEGARIQLVAAGPVIRSIALGIDLGIRSMIFIIVIWVLVSALPVEGDLDELEGRGGSIAGVLLILYFVLNWLYTIVFEILMAATPGKRVMGLRVVHGNATPLTPGGAVVRNLLRVVDGLPIANLAGLFSMLIDSRFRRLGDLAADTLVVYRQSLEYEAGDKADNSLNPLPPPRNLSNAQQQAIVDFAERSRYITESRQQELAAILKPLMTADTDPVVRLQQWALWIRHGSSQ